VSSEPKLLPSSLNCTPTTPESSEALAVTVVLPETVAPALGAVMDTVGGLFTGPATVEIVSKVTFPVLPWQSVVSGPEPQITGMYVALGLTTAGPCGNLLQTPLVVSAVALLQACEDEFHFL
jgi:hypothetical protein